MTSSPAPDTASGLLLGLLALVVEFALFVGVFVLVSAAAGGDLRGAVAGSLAVVVLGVGWWLAMAPRAHRRLGVWSRAVVAALLGVAAGVGLWVVGSHVFGALLALGGLVLAACQLGMDGEHHG